MPNSSSAEASTILAYAAANTHDQPLQTLRPLAVIALLLAFDRGLEFALPLYAMILRGSIRSIEIKGCALPATMCLVIACYLFGGAALLARRPISLSLHYYGALIDFGRVAFIPLIQFALSIQADGLDFGRQWWKEIDSWASSLLHYYVMPVALPLIIAALCRGSRLRQTHGAG